MFSGLRKIEDVGFGRQKLSSCTAEAIEMTRNFNYKLLSQMEVESVGDRVGCGVVCETCIFRRARREEFSAAELMKDERV